jgi:hypothetical protein
MDRERVALDGCYDLQLSIKGLLASVGELSPGELAMAGCDPDEPPSLRVVEERLDDCRARYDALRGSLGWPAARDPQCRRWVSGASPGDN